MSVSREAMIANFDTAGLVYPQHSIDIKGIGIDQEVGEGLSGIATYTKLFRTENVLPHALTATYERAPIDQQLTIVSAACSVGAEADTIIATHNLNHLAVWRTGRLAMLGYDINPTALAKAEEGRYLASFGANSKRDTEQQRTLEKFGFETGLRMPLRGHYSVSSEGVREGHDVVFEQHDMTTSAPIEGEADLVLANNVLYHLDPESAHRFIYNAAQMLREGGVLSVGDSWWAFDRYMRSSNPLNHRRYKEWIHDAESILRGELGMKTIARGRHNLPNMFARDLSTSTS